MPKRATPDNHPRQALMKVLVTGGAGFIGSHLVDKLVKMGCDVVIYDNLEKQVHQGKFPKYLNRKARFVKADVRNYNLLKKNLLGSEILFHFASAVGVGQSQYQIKRYVDINIGGTANILDILANNKNRIKKIILSASMSSYGEGVYDCKKCGRVRPPLRTREQIASLKWEPVCPNCSGLLKTAGVKEEDSLLCNSIYAITKMTQEEMVLNFGRTYNVPVVILRFFNVYGIRQSLSNPYTGAVAIFVSRVKNNNPPIIYEDGLQTRDFVSVYDIVSACILSMKSPKADYQIFNVGTGKNIPIKYVAEKIISIMGKNLKPIILDKFRKGDVRHCFPSISKIKTTLGYKPKISFDEGLSDLIYASNRIEAIDRFEDAQSELGRRGLL